MDSPWSPVARDGTGHHRLPTAGRTLHGQASTPSFARCRDPTQRANIGDVVQPVIQPGPRYARVTAPA